MQMDGYFATTFPLLFRVLFLVNLGIAAWASNLYGLHLFGIDSEVVLGIQTSRYGIQPLHRVLIRIALWFSVFVGLSWLLYKFLAQQPEPRSQDSLIPSLSILVTLCILINPSQILFRNERMMFLKGRPCFADVIFADILTSYAKVLGDIYISVQMFLRSGKSTEVEAHWIGDWFAPCIMSIPYAIRFRQCILDYAHSDRSEITQLFNAAKYLTSFPVIFLSVMQRSFQQNTAIVNSNVWFGEYLIFRLWLLGIAINSLYSFWWDVTFDWGFELLRFHNGLRNSLHVDNHHPIIGDLHYSTTTDTPLITNSSVGRRFIRPAVDNQFWGLRPYLLLFKKPWPYYSAICVNLLLRLTWSLKLSPHLHNTAELEVGVFVLEGLEVIRRWLWVYLRIEWQALKLATVKQSHSVLQMDALDLHSDAAVNSELL